MRFFPSPTTPLDRARLKAFFRLLPLLFVCYVIAYIDRVNVGFAKLHMLADVGFNEAEYGFGMGIFFVGYLLLEIPGTLLVEKWSARKWICRIMVSWGIIAALTAFVRTPLQFSIVRFLLGLAEAGFFPGVIVYLTHWFPRRDRTKALAWFFIGTPIAQFIGPPVSALIMGGGSVSDPTRTFLGLVGWQWVFIFWGIPAVILGIVVLAKLTDRPAQATWLTDAERAALEAELAREKQEDHAASGHMTIGQALTNPKVLLLSAAYFFVVTGNYGMELYLPSIFEDWYHLDATKVAALVIIPPIGSLLGQILVGWNSDRTQERRWHATLPILIGATAIIVAPFTQGNVWMSVALFTVAMTGLKAYLPAFWALPSQFMTASAAAASIGLINSFGNLGGWVGPYMQGVVKETTKEYRYGLWFLAASMVVSAFIIFNLGIGARKTEAAPPRASEPEAAPVPEPV
jgi:ACS family tartrate transporter-like MFS transporter